MMTKRQFRWLICIYCVVVACSFIAEIWAESTVPKTVREIEPSLRWEDSLTFLYIILRISQAILLAALMSIVGLFYLWSPSRYIFLAVTICKILLIPLCIIWMVPTGWQVMFDELEVLLDGVILTICFFGPAKHLFCNSVKNEASKENSNIQQQD